MITVLHLDSKGNTCRSVFRMAKSTKVEPDGRGGLLQILRDEHERIVAGFVAGLVLNVQVED